jgi:RNA polymerase sigma-70 factor, ECF subfamily
MCRHRQVQATARAGESQLRTAAAWNGAVTDRSRDLPLHAIAPRAGEWKRAGDGRSARDALASDEALVNRIKRGDDGAFDELMRRCTPRLLQFIRWSVTDAALAEDVLQDVLLQVHRSLGRYRAESSFRTWLYSLARNVCRDHRRRWRHRSREQSLETTDARAFMTDAADPLAALTRAEQVQRVRDAVARLPDIFGTVLLLRDWEELSYQEIAQVLDIPVGTVRSRIHAAREHLALEIAREENQ